MGDRPDQTEQRKNGGDDREGRSQSRLDATFCSQQMCVRNLSFCVYVCYMHEYMNDDDLQLNDVS